MYFFAFSNSRENDDFSNTTLFLQKKESKIERTISPDSNCLKSLAPVSEGVYPTGGVRGFITSSSILPMSNGILGTEIGWGIESHLPAEKSVFFRNFFISTKIEKCNKKIGILSCNLVWLSFSLVPYCKQSFSQIRVYDYRNLSALYGIVDILNIITKSFTLSRHSWFCLLLI